MNDKDNIKPTITFNEFSKVDIRIGTVLKVELFEGLRNPAYKLWIDFGVLGIKKSSAQITDLYSEEELLGKQILAVVNFEKKQIKNFMSEVLVLGTYNNNQVILIQPEQVVHNGAKIT